MAYLPTLTPQSRRNLGVAAASAVVIVGATTLFFKTFPHLTPSIFKKSTKTSDDDDEISESTFIVPKTNVDDWSEEELKAFLKQVSNIFIINFVIIR
ncbi:hypothetical protein B5S29_g3230 [[Candida] boidinii]|nr:hypothetical protein B5S29_g3230 [[Candida] boidinii]